MRIFLDTNILFDALLQRDPWKDAAQAIVTASTAGQVEAIISSLTVANLYYVGRKLLGKPRALNAVRECLANFEIAAVDRDALEHAARSAGVDFEDQIQLAVAQAANVVAIVTRDRQGFAASTIPILGPQEFLQRLTTNN